MQKQKQKHLVWFAASFALFMILGIFKDKETDSTNRQETSKTPLKHSRESVEDKKRDVEATEAKKKEEEIEVAEDTFAMGNILEFKETWEQVTIRSGMERINVISNEEFLEAEDSLSYTAEINNYILVQVELDIVTEENRSILLETIPTEGEPINVAMDISIAHCNINSCYKARINCR
ncbi:hypothetical protein ACWNS2_10150 [Planococcus plakortidis]